MHASPEAPSRAHLCARQPQQDQGVAVRQDLVQLVNGDGTRGQVGPDGPAVDQAHVRGRQRRQVRQCPAAPADKTHATC
jgi:hypothetical protein